MESKAVIAARPLLGLVFFGFGLNGPMQSSPTTGAGPGGSVHRRAGGEPLLLPAGVPDTLQPNPKGDTTIPEEKIVLRYTNAIQEKYRKYQRYLRDGRVGKNDAYVIAISAANLLHRWTQAEDDAPRFVKAVYPLGQYQLLLDRITGDIVGRQNETRFEIMKASGKKVAVHAFMDRRSRGISGVLCSFAHACYSGPLGLDFELAFNPMGRSQLPPDLITAKRIWTANLTEAGGNWWGAP